ncbi:MAG: hypothetical protein AAF934_08485, partial [Bacteroidota bacterium]
MENITKAKPIKISGTVSANGIYYTSNQNTNRIPFTYFLRGNLNTSIYGFSIPVSYSITNPGKQLDYTLPFSFNRISLHPKYKWITAHIGDVAMNFSPYTLNGHQFTGGGIDLSPPGVFKISAMVGRLLKATPDNDNEKTVPAFQRMGYGLKTRFEKEKFNIQLIGFYAKDNINSIDSVPEAKGILPKENLVLSLNTNIKLTKELTIDAEYASTAITQDLRTSKTATNRSTLTSLLFSSRTSTAFYNAFKANINYTVGRTTVGLGYERIDPGYETLGAYFFNNDFRNITLNAASSLLKDKFTVAINIGYQRDDLKNQKSNATNRFVGAINAAFTPSDRLNIIGSYSNFQTFTNIKPDQFDIINDDNLLDDDIEDLNYRQLSQSATLGITYVLSRNEDINQNLSFNYALNDVANEQGGIVRIGDASTFHNLATGYTLAFPKTKLTLNSGANLTYNTIGTENAVTWGPNASIGKRFFENTLGTRLGLSYNTAQSSAGKTQIANIRLSLNYKLLDHHHFNASVVQLFRSGTTIRRLSEFTATFGYNHTFGIKKPKFHKKDNSWMRFSYRERTYQGTPQEITPQLETVAKEKEYTITLKKYKQALKLHHHIVVQSQDKQPKRYKKAALDYLETLYAYEDFLNKYDQWIFKAYLKLIKEAEKIDSQIKQEYIELKEKVNTHKKQ